MGKAAEQSNSGERASARAAFWCSLGAELLGTAALTFVAAGGEVIAVRSGGQVDALARATAPGLMVMAVIYAFGQVSGAHINPAVTLAFALRRDFPWRRVPAYWIAQGVGAILAALFLRSLFGTIAHVGVTRAKEGVSTAFAMEIVLTLILVSIILGTATRAKVVGPNAAIAVGATVALCGLFAAPVSGASMNPARSLGPALVAGYWSHQWIYLVAPAIGGTLAAGIATVIHGPPQPAEEEAAEGDANHRADHGQQASPGEPRHVDDDDHAPLDDAPAVHRPGQGSDGARMPSASGAERQKAPGLVSGRRARHVPRSPRRSSRSGVAPR